MRTTKRVRARTTTSVRLDAGDDSKRASSSLRRTMRGTQSACPPCLFAINATLQTAGVSRVLYNVCKINSGCATG